MKTGIFQYPEIHISGVAEVVLFTLTSKLYLLEGDKEKRDFSFTCQKIKCISLNWLNTNWIS